MIHLAAFLLRLGLSSSAGSAAGTLVREDVSFREQLGTASGALTLSGTLTHPSGAAPTARRGVLLISGSGPNDRSR